MVGPGATGGHQGATGGAAHTSSGSGSRSSRRLRDSCQACAASKVRCPKEKPACSRCEGRSLACQYALTRRPGRRPANNNNNNNNNKRRRQSHPSAGSRGTAASGSSGDDAEGGGFPAGGGAAAAALWRAPQPPGWACLLPDKGAVTAPAGDGNLPDMSPQVLSIPPPPPPPPPDQVFVTDSANIFSVLEETDMFSTLAEYNADIFSMLLQEEADMLYMLAGFDPNCSSDMNLIMSPPAESPLAMLPAMLPATGCCSGDMAEAEDADIISLLLVPPQGATGGMGHMACARAYPAALAPATNHYTTKTPEVLARDKHDDLLAATRPRVPQTTRDPLCAYLTQQPLDPPGAFCAAEWSVPSQAAASGPEALGCIPDPHARALVDRLSPRLARPAEGASWTAAVAGMGPPAPFSATIQLGQVEGE